MPRKNPEIFASASALCFSNVLLKISSDREGSKMLRTVAIVNVLLALSTFTALLATISKASPVHFSAPLLERANTVRATRATLVAPTGWSLSWTLTGKRPSVASTAAISYFTLAQTATTVTQANVDKCVQSCTATAACGFVSVIQVSGSTKGAVQCALYKAFVDPRTAPLYTTGPGGGTVKYSYGYNRMQKTTTTTSIKTTSKATTTTPRISVTTTSVTVTTTPSRTTTSLATSQATTTSSLTAATTTTSTSTIVVAPTAPAGATLVQIKGCSSSSASIPAFVNSAFTEGSSATVAYISQHGSDTGPNDAFSYVSGVVGATTYPIVAPGIYYSDALTVPSTYYDPTINIAWSSANPSWSFGTDATHPDGISSCSSYDVYDTLLKTLNSDTTRFPNLQKVVVVGFSAGANLVTRYSTLSADNWRFSVRYIVGSPASQAYFSAPRPWLETCSDAFVYPYQWVSTSMPRYVSAAFGSYNGASLMRRWLARDVVSLVGTADTSEGTETCAAISSGGRTRRGRSYAYWAYKNLAASTSTDVSAYQGYGNLTATGASTPLVAGATFAHRNCIVANAEHNGYAVLQSSCGSAALRFQTLPAGSDPVTA